MVKQSKRNRKVVVKKPRAIARRQRGGGELAGYQKLLVDPCNAPLVKPPYSGAEGAFQMRYAAMRVSTNVSSVYFFHPTFGLFYGDAVDSATGITLAGFAPNAGVSNIAGSYRAIAGCLECMWIGAESARQGTFVCGTVEGSYVYNMLATAAGGPAAPTAKTVGELRSQLVSETRIPIDKCTVNYCPDTFDENFFPKIQTGSYAAANQAVLSQWVPRATFLCILVNQGAVGSTQIRYTGVLDVKPDVNTGLTSGGYGTAPRTSTYTAAIAALSAKDPQWYLDTFKKTGTLLGGTMAGFATGGLPGALGYLVSRIPTALTRGDAMR